MFVTVWNRPRRLRRHHKHNTDVRGAFKIRSVLQRFAAATLVSVTIVTSSCLVTFAAGSHRASLITPLPRLATTVRQRPYTQTSILRFHFNCVFIAQTYLQDNCIKFARFLQSMPIYLYCECYCYQPARQNKSCTLSFSLTSDRCQYTKTK